MQLPHIPFELILFLLFAVLPALGNLIRHLTKGPNKGQPSQPSRPARADKAAPKAPAETRTTPSSQPTKQPNATPAEDWLEQARRRVAEAQGRESAGKGSTPSSPPLVRPRQPQAQGSNRPSTPKRAPQERARPGSEGRSLESRGRENRSLEGASLEGRSVESSRTPFTSLETSLTERDLMSEAPPIRVQRLNPAKRATITGQELRFDVHDLVKGLIWHQVLSPPRSTLRRTRLSRRQR